MLKIVDIVKYTEEHIASHIEDAAKHAASDKQNHVARRKNEPYYNLLVRASLSLAQSIEIDSLMQSLCVSTPELLFTGMFKLGYGEARGNNKGASKEQVDCPDLLCSYYRGFKDDSVLKDSTRMIESIKCNKINNVLLCHGLSAYDDTILLLADIGRCKRISNALGVSNLEIMLADISWIKHNRSLNKLYNTTDDFMKDLRVCLDKRSRIYKALNLCFNAFGISDAANSTYNMNKGTLLRSMSKWRDLACAIWGDSVLGAHSVEVKKAIGTPFDRLISHKNNNLLSDVFRSLLSLNTDIPTKMEELLKNELSALRTISDLFSSFDDNIFMYYFAQYYAQSQYNNYLKIANISEKKFDRPFSQKNSNFSALVGMASQDNTNTHQLYLPWYKLGEYEILPYTSTSGDVTKESPNCSDRIRQFADNTIFLGDYSQDKSKKIHNVIVSTPIEHRNRLASDILSFIRILPVATLSDKLKGAIGSLSEEICTQITSSADDMASTRRFYSDWLQSIRKPDAVMPFHLIPYLWEDTDWNNTRLQAFTDVLLHTLSLVHEICE